MPDHYVTVHGGNLRLLNQRSGLAAEQLLDFSANINPLSLPDWLRGHHKKWNKSYVKDFGLILTAIKFKLVLLVMEAVSLVVLHHILNVNAPFFLAHPPSDPTHSC